MRRFTALLAALACALGAAGAQAAEDTGPDNVVDVETAGTNVTEAKSKLKLGSYGGDNLQSENVASAYSHDCTDCRTIAVAVQAVFVTGDPATAEPKNVAVAVNERCVRCTTFAYAYQYVVSTDGRVRLNDETRDDVRRIRREIDQVAGSDLAPPDMDARLQQLTDEFKAEIDEGLAAGGEDAHGRVRERRDER
jgi:opacity protein-like surface antigen